MLTTQHGGGRDIEGGTIVNRSKREMAEQHVDSLIAQVQARDSEFFMSPEDREEAIQRELLLRATAKNLGGGRTGKGKK